jgi:hypothetical protein
MTRDPRDEAYEPAQYCISGHLITYFAESEPDSTEDRCRRCGSPTITQCPKCKSIIRGFKHGGMSPTERPAYCHRCGEPYPWMEQAVIAAKALAQTLAASPEDARLLEASIDDMVRDTPAATVAAVRFKSMVAKAGQSVADAFRDILVDVLSEAVKKTIWPEAPPSRRR